jgi:uncharacterized membrane protein YuzA (DUF378 family)
MASNPQRDWYIACLVFGIIVLIGAINWGVQACAQRDIIALITNTAHKAGGSAMQDNLVLLPYNEASRVVPRVVYGLVGISGIMVAVCLIVLSTLPGMRQPLRT